VILKFDFYLNLNIFNNLKNLNFFMAQRTTNNIGGDGNEKPSIKLH
jgi:hypothetical protein